MSVALFLAAMTAAAVDAQGTDPGTEIGFRGGLFVYSSEGETTNVIAIPAGGLFSPGTVHVTMFVGPTLALEPQVGFIRFGSGSSSSGSISLALQVNQFMRDASSSPFAFLNLGVVKGFSSSGSGDALFTAGGGAGYRAVLSDVMALRGEGRYLRYFGMDDGSLNEFSLLVGLGVVVGGSR